MSAITETLLLPLESLLSPAADPEPGRRADVDAKQARVGQLLREAGCDGLLVFEPENFAWLTAGAFSRGTLDPAEAPVLYFSAEQRWLLCGNAASHRMFDEELDGLGFQLKEWPWHWGRHQLLADLTHGRAVASDRPFGEMKGVAAPLRQLRRALSPYEQACLRAAGQVVSHAVEATCRTMQPGETERELAGQVTHRLLHRGALPVHVGIAADGRSRLYRQFGFTSTPARQSAVMTVTARKYGLHVSASRTVSFGPPDDALRQEHSAVCKVGATYLASTWPDALPREILAAGRRVYALSGYEHEWRAAPQGFVTGRAAVEVMMTPKTEELFQGGWAVTWSAGAGAAVGCDTFLVNEEGPQCVTPTETWPLKRIRVQGADFVRPDILQR